MMRLTCAALLLVSMAGAAFAAPPVPPAPPASSSTLPSEPLVVDLKAAGRQPGKRGGTLRMLMSKEKDVRLLNTWGYARLVGWTSKLELKPDLLKSIEVKDGRIFTMRLRAGHKWSDGSPFTAEDFRYFWDDVASNKELSPAGPPVDLINGGELPKVEIVDPLTVRYTWSKPNSRFLAALAQAREPYIYRPSRYLKQFHTKYADKAALSKRVAEARVQSWARLHNQMDSIDDNDNPALPTLQPWVATTAMPSNRFVFKRNPYFHRVDSAGVQLPYIDAIEVAITDSGLVSAKTAAGDSDLQARGLSFGDITVLKANQAKGSYKVLTWPIAKGSHVALYPNLNASDAGWRALVRDVKFRRALSLGINRSDINKALFFGLAAEGNNTVLKDSPLFKPAYLTTNASYDPKTANALLDELGLKARNAEGTRLMADKRPLEMVVETAGEAKEETDVLQLIAQHYKAIGIKLVVKPSDRTIMRNRAYAGEAVMTARSGWDTGIPTTETSPDELAPTRQDNLIWPKWGQFYETNGKVGEAADLPAAQELLKLDAVWSSAKTPAERKAAWEKMLAIHTEQQFIIGTVAGVMQPIAVRNTLKNVPEKGVFSWDPGAQFGMYRMDEFWFGP
ncbi:MAG: ABC transporter substrate-binding protein [Alphaproteobacteria bacterium]|nr:ABC transporter substrate-binding protein [Alphaproteobacteria bacterium]